MRLVTFHDRARPPRVGRLEGEGAQARVVELAAPTMLHWLRGDGHAPAGRDHALSDVVLLAPVPDPPAVRDFFSYEGHVATGWRLRGRDVPEAWFQTPVF
jgi:fumarylacetoacetate (FAA) hydrolase